MFFNAVLVLVTCLKEDTKKKKFISKMSVDSNFTFTKYVRLCLINYCIDYCIKLIWSTRIGVKIVLISH